MDTKEIEFRLVIPMDIWEEELELGEMSEETALASMLDGLQSMMAEGVEAKLLRVFTGHVPENF